MGAEALHDKIDDKIIDNDDFNDIEYNSESNSESTSPIVSITKNNFISHSNSKSFKDLSLSENLPNSVNLPSPSALTKPLIIAYILSAILIAILGGGGFLIYREADVVKNSFGDPEPGCSDKVCQNVILNLSPGILR
eukprot:gene19647-25559_t